jgi:hypothetical protein
MTANCSFVAVVVVVVCILGWRNVVGIGEGEDEAICVCSICICAVPGDWRITPKEVIVLRTDDSDSGSLVVTMFVKVLCIKSITEKKKE